MIELLLKSSLAIAVALLFYKAVLQQESFFATNRVYLLGCLILAFALPFINLPKLVNQQGYLSSVIAEKFSPERFSSEEVSKKAFSAPPEKSSLAEFPVSSGPSEVKTLTPSEEFDAVTAAKVKIAREVQPVTDPLPQQIEPVEESLLPVLNLQIWLMLLYFFGVAVLSASLLFQIGCIFFEIIRSGDKIRDGSYIIVNTATKKAPCSFFNYIFIYPDDYDFEAYEQIIKHEKTHIRLGHSFDLLLAELAVIILWFNPLIWLFRKEIEKNNEYQTDSILVEKEQVRKDRYQLNLLQIAVPNKPLNITTNYNQSLIKKRIVMMNSKRSTPHAYWKYAFLVPLFLGMLLLMNEPATGQETKKKTSAETEQEAAASEENRRDSLQEERANLLRKRQNMLEQRANRERQNAQIQERIAGAEVRQENVQQQIITRTALLERRNISFRERASQTDITSGFWYSSIRNGKLCIEFRGSNEDSRWNISECFERSAFNKTGNNTFVMKNEAGTLVLTGNLNAEVGQGKYEFNENASFRNFLSQNNISDISKSAMFHLFFGEMTKDYVNYLVNQYRDVDGEELTALAIHGIKQEQFRNFVNLFSKYSNENPEIDDIVGLKIHGVTEEYVEELQKMGFYDLSLDEIMSAKIHGISAAYAQELKNAGFDDLSLDEIIAAKIHGLAPQTIKDMRALGAGDLDEIVQLQIHNVSADYMKQLEAAGLGGLSLDEVVSAKIHDLDASAIKEIKDLGFQDLDFDDLLTARIHGVDANFVKELKSAGFDDLSMDDVVSARIHGIDGEFIAEARKDGYNLNSIDKYISLKIHGRALEALKEE